MQRKLARLSSKTMVDRAAAAQARKQWVTGLCWHQSNEGAESGPLHWGNASHQNRPGYVPKLRKVGVCCSSEVHAVHNRQQLGTWSWTVMLFPTGAMQQIQHPASIAFCSAYALASWRMLPKRLISKGRKFLNLLSSKSMRMISSATLDTLRKSCSPLSLRCMRAVSSDAAPGSAAAPLKAVVLSPGIVDHCCERDGCCAAQSCLFRSCRPPRQVWRQWTHRSAPMTSGRPPWDPAGRPVRSACRSCTPTHAAHRQQEHIDGAHGCRCWHLPALVLP